MFFDVLLMFTFTFSHLADAFIQRDLQMRTIEAIKTNKRATTCKLFMLVSYAHQGYIYLMKNTVKQ